jgi:hypothetical protein
VTGFPVSPRPRLAEFTTADPRGVAKVLAVPAVLDPVRGDECDVSDSDECATTESLARRSAAPGEVEALKTDRHVGPMSSGRLRLRLPARLQRGGHER